METSSNASVVSNNESNSDVASPSTSTSVGMEKYLLKTSEPRDRYHVAHIIFYLLGIITLLPWNFFITADDYWMYKFRDPHSKLNLMVPPKRTKLQARFTSYLSLASNLPNLFFLIVNIGISHRISVQKRMVGSLLVIFLLFILTTVFVQVNTDGWETGFFIVTLTTVVFLNATSAILSGTLFGIVGKFSTKYLTAVIAGQALGGIFAAIAEIISLTVGASSVHSAFVYFMIGNFMILFSFIGYLVLSRSDFFNFHLSHGGEHEPDLLHPGNVSYKHIVKKIWPYAVSLTLVFSITLSMYPSITVLIESEGKGHGSRWNDVYFVPVVAYLIFSLWDYIGRIVAGSLRSPKNGRLLIILSLLRLVFVPLLMLCNVQPRSSLPVVFDKDYYYIILITLFAFSNGFFANLSLIWAPKVVDHHEREIASSMMAVCLGLGLTIGASFSVLLVDFL